MQLQHVSILSFLHVEEAEQTTVPEEFPGSTA